MNLGHTKHAIAMLCLLWRPCSAGCPVSLAVTLRHCAAVYNEAYDAWDSLGGMRNCSLPGCCGGV